MIFQIIDNKYYLLSTKTPHKIRIVRTNRSGAHRAPTYSKTLQNPRADDISPFALNFKLHGRTGKSNARRCSNISATQMCKIGDGPLSLQNISGRVRRGR